MGFHGKAPRRGVIFTLDAIVAVIAAALMITSSYSYLSGAKPSEWGIIDLGLLATDSLAALEINNDLEGVIISGSATILDTFLSNMLPSRVCGRIRIYTSGKTLLYNSTKTNCNVSAADTVSVSLRSFIAQEGIYYAKMEAWYEY